jgi:parallel beta-helix repeat protein
MLPHLFSIPLLVSLATAAAGTIYHIDSSSGDDSRSGTAPEQAWRSLEKANDVRLEPGDRLLFKAGGRWSGGFKPGGAGSKERPVRIGRYGEGALPRIDGGGVEDALLLENFPHVEVADLEITNRGETRAPWRTGVKVSAEGSGRLENITLRRLFVHDVNGDLRKSHEGCGIFFEAKGGGDTHFDGLLIEGCRVERADRNGICQRGLGRARSRNVIIRGNTLEDIGGDGIKLWGSDGGLIERNVVRKARARCTENEAAAGIWPFACDDTLIQFNEVSGTLGTRDGQAYDSDYWCRRTVFQYNYSYQNEGGFMLICTPGHAINEDTMIRHNISVHDGIDTARVFHFGGGAARTRVYHNTIVIGARQKLPMMLFTEWDGGRARDSVFANNLFIVEQGGRAVYDFGTSTGNVWEDNVFVGSHTGLPEGARAAQMPRFKGPLVPKPGFESLRAFTPADAERFPRGKPIADNGGRDFFGKPLPGGPPAVGAIEP